MIRKFLNIEKYKTWQLVSLIILIIIILPPLFVLPAFFKFWNFSNSASIGETIGGITSPFISGLAAVLVFLAFKAQIKANQIITNQEKSRNILSQLSLIQDDKLEIEKVIGMLLNRTELFKQSSTIQVVNQLNKVIFFTTEIRLAFELIGEYEGEKDFLYRKLYYLYVVRYKDLFSSFTAALNVDTAHMDYQIPIVELLFQIKFLNANLIDSELYK